MLRHPGRGRSHPGIGTLGSMRSVKEDALKSKKPALLRPVRLVTVHEPVSNTPLPASQA
jgi:hypothetical protein